MLKPIGFDVPQTSPPVQTQAPQVNTAPVASQGLNILSQSTQQFAQGLQAQSQSAESQAQAAQSLSQATVNSNESISRAAAYATQVRAQNSTGGFLKAATDIASFVSKQREAQLKRDQEQAKVSAVRELENARIDWIEQGRIGKEGTGGYRNAISEVMGRYSLSADDVVSLTSTYFAPAVDYAKQTEANRQETLVKIAEQQRRITTAGLQGELSSAFAGLVDSVDLGPAAMEQRYAKVQASVKGMMSREDIPMIDRLTAVAQVYETTNEIMAKRNVEDARLKSELQSFRQLSTYATELREQVLNGTLTPSAYQYRLEEKALQMGVQFKVPDPQADMRFLYDSQKLSYDIRQLRQSQVDNDLQSLEADDLVIQGLASQFALDPTALAAAKAQGNKLDRNAKAAIALVEDFNRWQQDDGARYQTQKAQLNTEMASIQQDFYQWYINAANRGSAGSSPSEAKILEQLRIGGVLPTSAASQQALTPEQVELVRASTAAIIDAKRQESNALDQAFQDRKLQFEQSGLFLSREQTAAHSKEVQQRLEAYRAKVRAIETQRLSTPQAQPGQSPNFNGGAPAKPSTWSPMHRQLYGGKTITMPFLQGTQVPPLFEGQEYGAYRTPTRRHGGLDFAVPIGTPTTSMVFGTVSRINMEDNAGYGRYVEISGDDGMTYFYAHLDKALVTMGQRVSPSMVIAHTGDTGAGGPHLHLEIAPIGTPTATVNPVDHLSTRTFGPPPKGVRTAGEGVTPTTLSPRAIPIGSGYYLIDGKVSQAGGSVPAGYTAQQPLRSSYASNSHHAMYSDVEGTGTPYAVFQQDPEFKAAVVRVAANLNLNPAWLADLMAYESAGTFSTSITNDWGYTGLIQFGAAAQQDLGVTAQQLKRMTRAQQMTYVEKYLRLQMRYAGVTELRGPEELIAAVNQGHTVLRDVRARGHAAVLDPSNRDGAGTTLKYYLESLGKYSGRKYRFMGGRSKRLSDSLIHERVYAGCTMCNQLSAQSQFIPHEGVKA